MESDSPVWDTTRNFDSPAQNTTWNLTLRCAVYYNMESDSGVKYTKEIVSPVWNTTLNHTLRPGIHRIKLCGRKK
jgi:hypothetical protein